MSPHFGFFKLVIDLVDGPIDRENDGQIVPDDHTLVIIDDRPGSEIAIAA